MNKIVRIVKKTLNKNLNYQIKSQNNNKIKINLILKRDWSNYLKYSQSIFSIENNYSEMRYKLNMNIEYSIY